MLKNYISKYRDYKNRNKLVQNINLNLSLNKQKRVLISYLSDSFHINYEKDSIFQPNVLEINQIIRCFIAKNYVIDCIHANADECFNRISNKKYDVVFGFGKVFKEASKKNVDALKICYITENHPDFSFQKESERINYYFERHKITTKHSRTNIYYDSNTFTGIDYAINMGFKDHYKDLVDKTYSIYPTGLKNSKYTYEPRDIEQSKLNFLWFGSRGVIHKGLDILVDIFKKRDDIALHICGMKKEEKKYLKGINKKNIHNYGRINVYSDTFLEIVQKCSFIILPSCSEAISTSILTCMRHSMIPIIIKNTTRLEELNDYIFVSDSFKISDLDEFINQLISLPNEILEKRHNDIFEFANENFTIENYDIRINEIMDLILI